MLVHRPHRLCGRRAHRGAQPHAPHVHESRAAPATVRMLSRRNKTMQEKGMYSRRRGARYVVVRFLVRWKNCDVLGTVYRTCACSYSV